MNTRNSRSAGDNRDSIARATGYGRANKLNRDMKKGPARKLQRLIRTIAFPIPNISLARIPTSCPFLYRRGVRRGWCPSPTSFRQLLSFIYLFHPFYGITIGRGARHGPIKLQNNFGRLRRFRVPPRSCVREDCAGRR